MRAKTNRVVEGNGGRFQGRRKGKEKSFCFVVVKSELMFDHPCFYDVWKKKKKKKKEEEEEERYFYSTHLTHQVGAQKSLQ